MKKTSRLFTLAMAGLLAVSGAGCSSKSSKSSSGEKQQEMETRKVEKSDAADEGKQEDKQAEKAEQAEQAEQADHQRGERQGRELPDLVPRGGLPGRRRVRPRLRHGTRGRKFDQRQEGQVDHLPAGIQDQGQVTRRDRGQGTLLVGRHRTGQRQVRA